MVLNRDFTKRIRERNAPRVPVPPSCGVSCQKTFVKKTKKKQLVRIVMNSTVCFNFNLKPVSKKSVDDSFTGIPRRTVHFKRQVCSFATHHAQLRRISELGIKKDNERAEAV